MVFVAVSTNVELIVVVGAVIVDVDVTTVEASTVVVQRSGVRRPRSFKCCVGGALGT